MSVSYKNNKINRASVRLHKNATQIKKTSLFKNNKRGMYYTQMKKLVGLLSGSIKIVQSRTRRNRCRSRTKAGHKSQQRKKTQAQVQLDSEIVNL